MSLPRPLHNRGTYDGLAADSRRAIGALVRRERIRMGMTQETVGLRLGVQKTAISGIETGCQSLAPEKYQPLFVGVFGLDPATVGQFLLRQVNPFLYALIHGQASVPELALTRHDKPPVEPAEQAAKDQQERERALARRQAIRDGAKAARFRVVRVHGPL